MVARRSVENNMNDAFDWIRTIAAYLVGDDVVEWGINEKEDELP